MKCDICHKEAFGYKRCVIITTTKEITLCERCYEALKNNNITKDRIKEVSDERAIR